MADLLECVIQIKALGEALEMVTLPNSDPAFTGTERATISGVWRGWQTPSGATRGRWARAAPPRFRRRTRRRARRVFVALRRSNLARLDGCNRLPSSTDRFEWPAGHRRRFADWCRHAGERYRRPWAVCVVPDPFTGTVAAPERAGRPVVE